MTDLVESGGSDLDIDLESGGTTSEEDTNKDHRLGAANSRKLLQRVWSGFMGGVESGNGDASTSGRDGICSYHNMLNSDKISVKDGEIWSDRLGEKIAKFVDKKMARENAKKANFEKPPKPPRPPRGPKLDAADMKLVKEISELATIKRRRIERLRALKKMKKEKASSACSNLCAMVVTILFFFVIIFQGLLGSRV